MTMFLIQSAILLAIAFILGAILGCLLKRMFASDDVSVPVATAAVATTAAASAYVPKAEPVSAPKPDLLPEPAPAPSIAAPIVAAAPAVAKVVAAPKAVAKSKTPAKPKAAAKPKVASKPKAAIASVKDDLKLIVGIGPVNERKLNEHGVATFAQIAGWKKPDIVEAEKYLEFDGRIEREEWVRQAKNLAAGGKPDAPGKRAPRKDAVANAPVAKSAISAKPATRPKSVGLIGLGTAKSAKSDAPKVAKTTAPKTAALKPVAKPAVKAAPAKKPMTVKLAKPVGGKPDNLTLINGIGNVIERKLHEMGVFHFEQVANWNDEQAAHFSKAVGFPGRAKREGWMKEAALFAKGGTTEHARKVEAGEIPTSRKSTKAEKGKK